MRFIGDHVFACVFTSKFEIKMTNVKIFKDYIISYFINNVAAIHCTKLV